jgi:hypothetical protein
VPFTLEGVKTIHASLLLLGAASCAATTAPPPTMPTTTPTTPTKTGTGIAFNVDCLAQLDSHHCTTWARDPGCGAPTCPLVASVYLGRIAVREPSLLVPYLRDHRAPVHRWVRYTLLFEYGDDDLSDFEVELKASTERTPAHDRRETFIEKWEYFAAGQRGLPRRSPSAPVEHGTIPRCWPSLRPPPWWPNDGEDWPTVHPAPTCYEGGSVVPGGRQR